MNVDPRPANAVPDSMSLIAADAVILFDRLAGQIETSAPEVAGSLHVSVLLMAVNGLRTAESNLRLRIRALAVSEIVTVERLSRAAPKRG